MKSLVAIFFTFFFIAISCQGRSPTRPPKITSNLSECVQIESLDIKEGGIDSVIIDPRCDKIQKARGKKADALGLCDLKPEYAEKKAQGEPIGLVPKSERYVSWDKCVEFMKVADEQCRALPPDPNKKEVLSRTIVYKNGKPILIDGQPVCPQD